jgi:large subunit ribosomal protein L9
MRVIFLADVPGSGQAGDIKEVKNGYARNFLLPKTLAVPATHDHLQRIETIRKVGEKRRIKEEQDIRALTEQLATLSISLSAKMGPTGKFYGAVTSTQLAEELHRLTEREIERRNIRLEAPIQEPGEYQAEMRLGYGVSTTLQFVVDAEGDEGGVLARKAEAEAASAENEQAETIEVVVQAKNSEEEGQDEQVSETEATDAASEEGQSEDDTGNQTEETTESEQKA